jgi:thiol-disulfide isomerase/thioredoxin
MSVTAYHFWSPSCGPCKVIKPAIEDLKEEFSQVVWVSVNTHDDTDQLAVKYGVSVVPTIVVESKDASGAVINLDKQVGTTMGAYYRIIRNALRITQLL